LSGVAASVCEVNAVRVPWSSPSFLVYLGGLTIFAALGSLLAVQAGQYSPAGFAGWALLVFVLVSVLAMLARLSGLRVTAGLLALSSVAGYVVLLGALLEWFGWLTKPTDSAFAGFHVSILFLELSLVLAAGLALLVFRFPLLVFVLAAGFWFFVTDLLSGGGDWSAVLTILVGLVLLSWAIALDRNTARPYAFWLHVVAGLTIGGGLLWLFHHGDGDWIVIALIGLLYIWLGDHLLRSSWVVLGAWAVLQATAHFAIEWANTVSPAFFIVFYLFPFTFLDAFNSTSIDQSSHPWAVPFTFMVAGGLLMGLGLVVARRRRSKAIPGAELL
jgi:hypothetical protein